MVDPSEMLRLLEAADDFNEPKILRAPLVYPGGKNKLAPEIIKYLPYRKRYIEPFGGSAAVLLARQPCRLEVFNDRYAGIVAFYRCIRDERLLSRLKDRLDKTVHSREEWQWCKETWEEDTLSDVERAARWYYMTMYSFSRLGRHFGRSTSSNARLPSIRDIIPEFNDVHKRFKNVQIENLDWYDCITQYDSEESVFYIDPPYLGKDLGIYTNRMTIDDHRNLISLIDRTEGFVALSGYENEIYDSIDWDDRIEWEVKSTMKSYAYTESNCKEQLKGLETRETKKEILWIKDN